MSFGAGAEAIVMNQVVKEWNFRPAEEEMQTEIEQLDSDNMQLDAEIERLEKVEAAAKDIYFAGQWVMICGSKTKDKPLWDALKEATGWSVSGGSK
jgi:CRISPR/Cas system-associated endonuclease Cas1